VIVVTDFEALAKAPKDVQEQVGAMLEVQALQAVGSAAWWAYATQKFTGAAVEYGLAA
jgi:hypothetical protein